MNGFQLGFGVYYLIYVLRFSEVAFDKLQRPGARFFTTVMGMTQFVMSAAMFLMTALFPDDRDFRFHCSIWLSVALLYPLVISVCKSIVSSDHRHLKIMKILMGFFSLASLQICMHISNYVRIVISRQKENMACR